MNYDCKKVYSTGPGGGFVITEAFLLERKEVVELDSVGDDAKNFLEEGGWLLLLLFFFFEIWKFETPTLMQKMSGMRFKI